MVKPPHLQEKKTSEKTRDHRRLSVEDSFRDTNIVTWYWREMEVVLEAWYLRRPTECVSPSGPSDSSLFIRPRRIFSSFGNGGKKSGGGGWPGIISGMLGGAEVNADRLCAYARSSG